jgi:hypothetical protein
MPGPAGPAPGPDDLPPVPPPLPPEWSEALGLARGQYVPGPAVDRRASAALEPPSVDRERRNAVALSLAGLFDDLAAPDPTVPATAPLTTDEPGPRKPRTSPEPWSYEEPEDAVRPAQHRRGGLRTLLTPGGLIALVAVVASLYVVAFFVSRANPPKAPGDQVTTVAPSR